MPQAPALPGVREAVREALEHEDGAEATRELPAPGLI